MVDTPRTEAYLTGTTFRDGQAAGAITPNAVRDFVVSVPKWDDPTASIGAPAILMGTVYGHKASGLTVGTGMSTGVRQANATALQNAINYAVTNKKIFELYPGTYEIDNTAGIVIPGSSFGFIWRGAKTTVGASGYGGSEIVQFNQSGTGAPVFTIGDLTTYMNKPDIRGLSVRYGNSQIGKTTANTLIIRGCCFGEISDIAVQPGGSYNQGGNPNGFGGYRGVLFTGNGLFFSMTLRNWEIWGSQYDQFYADNWNTGNVVENLYINGAGGSAYVPVANRAMYIGYGWGETVFDQINFEWMAANVLVEFGAAGSPTFNGLHFEGIKMTGTNPKLIHMTDSNVNINGMNVIDLIRLQANMSGTPVIISHTPYNPSLTHIKGLGLGGNLSGTDDLTVPTMLYSEGIGETSMAVGTNIFVAENVNLNESKFSNINLTSRMQKQQGFLPPYMWQHLEFGYSASRCVKAIINVTANYTHYGQHEDSLLMVNEQITSFSITLSNKMSSTGTEPTKTGTRVTIMRRGFSNQSGTLTVLNYNASSLGTLNVFNRMDLRFDGTNWVTYTAVSTSPYNG